MKKKVIYDEEARAKLKSGVDQLANAVRVTLGAKGRNVAISKPFGSPQVTKDGVTIAREIELEDISENIGAQMLKEVAVRTVDSVGDGTTTAVVLAQAIVHAGLKNIVAGANPMEVRSGIDAGVASIVKRLKEMAVHIEGKESIRRVALVSANGDNEVADILSEVITKVGHEGVVTIEEGHSIGIREHYVEGMQFDRGFLSPYFSDPQTLEVNLKNPYILLVSDRISAIAPLVPIIEKVIQSGHRELLIVADDVDGEALNTLVLNKLKGNLNVAAVKAPAFGERRRAMVEDLATLTGGQVISKELGFSLETTELEQLGRAGKVIINKDETTIIDGAGKPGDVQNRIALLRMEYEKSTSEYDKEKLQERIAKLSSGVAILEIGAATEVELKERKDRVEDALAATRAAIAEGIVSGGGIAFLDALQALDNIVVERDAKIGIDILRTALQEPYRRIMLNAGKDPAEYRRDVGNGQGYDVRREMIVDMVESGIIDPVKVTRLALENAASAAVMIITTEALVVHVPEEKDE